LDPETRNLKPETAENASGVAANRTPAHRFQMPKVVVLILGIALFFLHQDFWNWTDRTLLFGFMPVGLAYHALYSIAAALLWAYAIRIAWPKDLEAWAEEEDDAT
jgi:hypothetical protein